MRSFNARLPDFIYVGMGKCGTTWLYHQLRVHPSVCLAGSKETNFFDINFHRGVTWYESFFSDALDTQVIGEIGHFYIHRGPVVAKRIRTICGPIKILVCLRDPVSYIESSYQFEKRNGLANADLTHYVEQQFDWQQLTYMNMLRPYLDLFGNNGVRVLDFCEFTSSPQQYMNEITKFLGVSEIAVSAAPVNVAANSRSKIIARTLTKTAKLLRKRGGQRIIAFVKYKTPINRLLYRDLRPHERERIDDPLRGQIISRCSDQIEALSRRLNRDLLSDWGFG